MSINPQDRIHGACISEVVLELSNLAPSMSVRVDRGADRSSYLFECSDTNTKRTCRFGLYVKYSRKRLSPWSYSYEKEHQLQLENIATDMGEVFSVFINGEDGYACIDYRELREILDAHFDEVEWVRVQRKLRESYRISGTDGARERPLAQNAFPQKIIEYVSREILRTDSESRAEHAPELQVNTHKDSMLQTDIRLESGSNETLGIKGLFRRWLD